MDNTSAARPRPYYTEPMRVVRFLCLTLAAVAGSSMAWADEALNYNVRWPTGVALGRAKLVENSGTNLSFDLRIGIPGLAAMGSFASKLTAAGCTSAFTKKYELGFRRSAEFTSVDGQTARRQTANGGVSTFNVGSCGRDALAFIQFLRSELKAGRKPAAQTILFGAQYNLTLSYPTPVAAGVDTVQVRVQGPASDNTMQVDFLQDTARTPSTVRVQLPLGQMQLELVR
jgi:hypothetical protein